MSPKRDVPPKSKDQVGDSPAKKKTSIWNRKDKSTTAEVPMDAATSSTGHRPAGSRISPQDSLALDGHRGSSTDVSDSPSNTPTPTGSPKCAKLPIAASHVSQPSILDLEKEGAPGWFIAFEKRQQARFDAVMKECTICREEHEGMKLDIDNLRDEVNKLSTLLGEADLKIDDLENRSRRNNIVLFGVPEGLEGPDCVTFVVGLLKECNPRPLSETEVSNSIQRAHRSGQRHDVSDARGRGGSSGYRPRPIHVAFSSFSEKEKSRKSLVLLFKEKKFGPDGTKRFFVSDDFSRKVQKMRKDKLPELRKLRSEGKKVHLAYPATIRFH